MESAVANWSDLLPDILVEIAMKLKLFEDFTAFRGVCTSWRVRAPKDIFKGGKVPLLMLAENKYQDSDEREFYSLSRRKILRAALPEAKGKRCMDARFGWIVAVAPEGGEVYLFKPYSSSPTVPLPNFHTFPDYHGSRYEVMFVKKAILTANPSETSDFMVFVLMRHALGFWKNGDENWTMIESKVTFVATKNIGYCSHKMYAVDYKNRLWSWDPSATDLTQLQLQLTLNDFLYMRFGGIHPYMVESTAGELLMITRNNVYLDAYLEGATYFEVARIDVWKREWEVISGGIGRDAIFIGENAAVSVAADDFPGVIKPNCIYFTDDCIDAYAIIPRDKEGGKDMGIYNIEEGSIESYIYYILKARMFEDEPVTKSTGVLYFSTNPITGVTG